MNRLIKFSLLVAGSSLAPLALGDAAVKTPRVEERYLFSEQQLCTRVLKSDIFARTELLFGLSRAGGPDITEIRDDYKEFVPARIRAAHRRPVLRLFLIRTLLISTTARSRDVRAS